MVFDRPKRDGSESCPHSQKIKYNNGQIELSGNEWRLLSPTKNLSIHPRNTKMLSKSGYVYFEKEPIIEEACISDTDQRPRQHRECITNRLTKNHKPITSSNSSDSENYTEVCQRRIESDSDCTEIEGTSMVNPSRGIHNITNDLRRHRKHSDTRKEYGKTKHVPST
jgi:hypothetical protein